MPHSVANPNHTHPEQQISVPIGKSSLSGSLVVPRMATGAVLFAHGSGSSRHSPRNQYVAQSLNTLGLATLLLDLLTPEEAQIDEQTYHLRFDIGLLADRLVAATAWLRRSPLTAQLSLGYFGASTGSAAALLAAADRPGIIKAIVSRGGRPDLAGTALTRIQAPTLLIVGEHDSKVLALNQTALEKIHVQKQLKIVPNATHLFEESGALEQVAQLAGGWFQRYLLS